jgi:hypothetical protein
VNDTYRTGIYRFIRSLSGWRVLTEVSIGRCTPWRYCTISNPFQNDLRLDAG